MTPSKGTRAMQQRDREWEQTRKRRARAAARQKAARDALAYPDAPTGLTPEALDAYHRQLKADCLRRMAERRAA